MRSEKIVPEEITKERLIDYRSSVEHLSEFHRIKRAQPIQETSELIQLKRDLSSVKSSILNNFSVAAITVESGYWGMAISKKHSIMIFSDFSTNELHFYNLIDFERIGIFKCTFGSCFQVVINSDESKVYCSTSTGCIFSLHLPYDKYLECCKYQISNCGVTFSVHGNFIYAQSFKSCYIKQIDITTNSSEYIGRIDHIHKLLMSESGKYLALIGQKKLVVQNRRKFRYAIYYYQFPSSFILAASQGQNVYSDISFSHEDKYFIFACESWIKIVNTKQWKEVRTLNFPENMSICAIKTTTFSNKIIAVSQNNTVCIWDILGESIEPAFLNQHCIDSQIFTKMIRLEIDEDNGYVYTQEINKPFIYKSKCNFFTYKIIARQELLEFSKVIVCGNNNEVICIMTAIPKLIVYCLQSYRKKYEIEYQGSNIFDFVLQEVFEKYLYAISSGLLYVISTDTYEIMNRIPAATGRYTAIAYSSYNYMDCIIASDDKQHFSFFDYLGNNKSSFTIDYGYAVILKAYNNYLIIGTITNIISIYTIDNFSKQSCSKMFQSNLISIAIINSGQNILATFQDNHAVLLEFSNLLYYEKKIFECNIVECAVVKNRFLAALTDKKTILVFSVPTLEKILEITNNNFCSLAYEKDEDYIVALSENKILKFSHLFNESNPHIIGESINIPNIKDYLENNKKCSKGEQDEWLFFPYMVNSLHFYAAENKKKLLKHAIQLRKSKIINSFIGTPLTVSLLADNREISNFLIKELVRNIKDNLGNLKLLTEHLILMQSKDFKALEKLYDNCFIPCTFSSSPLPDYCDEKVKLPKIVYSTSEDIEPENFIEVNTNGTKRIKFMKCAFKISLEIGSKGSTEFLKSLASCGNKRIYRTKLIQYILKEKWDKIKWVHYMYSAAFCIYLLFLSMFSVNIYYPYLYLATIANGIMNVYEVLQFATAPWLYIKDVLNYIDLLKSIFLYACLAIESRYILTVATFLSWVRGITIFTLFKRTRPLINLLYYVLYDMIPFAAIVFYSILAFAFIRSTFTADTSITSRSLILEAYFNIVGDINRDGNELDITLTVFNSIFNTIIMLNLLISIIGTTYEEVNQNEIIEDMTKKIDLILEVESILLPLKKKNYLSIVQICDYSSSMHQRQEVELHNRIRGIKDELERMELRSASRQQSADVEINEMKHSITGLKKMIIDNHHSIIELLDRKANLLVYSESIKFLCFNGHDMALRKISFGQICNICYTELRNTSDYYCYFCDFIMCVTCSKYYQQNFYSNHTCFLGHPLIEYKDKASVIDLDEFNKQTCRFCNSDIEKNALYCVLCLYFVCPDCNEKVKSLAKINKHLPCKKQHLLKWKHQELYTENSLLVKCDLCLKTYLGAAFYSCNICKYFLCIKCYSRQALNS